MPRSPWGMPVLVALALLQGCIYISPDEFKEKKNSLDQDVDGSTLLLDCNDDDPLRFPENTEVAYDGIDQDCDPLLQDLLDIDGDGFAGVDKATYQAEHPDAPEWPDGLVEGSVDCNDDDDSVFPGAVDSWYDGVDSDCGGNDDYDQDGDEYVPDAYAAVSTHPAGDCDDTRADVGPGVAEDVWYNGVDEDCAKNNDFDADGDTYMPDSTASLTTAQLRKAFTDYINYYGYSYDEQYGDCQDQPAEDRPDIVPADVHPGGAEVWYDGIDSDCDTTNDFDSDFDGYIRNEDIGAYDEWLDYWGYDDVTDGANDCNDLDGSVHPGTIEALADATDQDCDGDADTTPWSDGDYEWNGVRPLVVGKNDLHYVLTTAAESTDASTYKQPGLSLIFPLDAGFAQKPDAVVVWQNVTTAPNPLGEVVDMVTGTDSFYVATQYYSSSAKNLYMIGKWVQWNATASSYSSKLEYYGLNTSSTGEEFYNDVDVELEPSSGKYWFLGCGDQSMNFMRVDPFATPTAWNYDAFGCDANSTSCQQFSGISATTCWLDVEGTTATANLCNGSDCTTYDLDGATEGVTVAATQPYDGLTWSSVNRSGDWLVAVQSDGAVYLSDGSASYTVFSDNAYEAQYATVSEDASGRLYIAAVVADETGDGLEDVVLAYGTPGSMTYMTVPLTDGTKTWHAEYAAAHVDDDRVMLAATGYVDGACSDSSGNCDTVSWMFLSPQ